MDNLHPFYTLDINTDTALIPTADIQNLQTIYPDQLNQDSTYGVWILYNGKDDFSKFFNLSWIEQVEKSLCIDILGAVIFYRGANFQNVIAHIDIDPEPEYQAVYGLNWVAHGSEHSTMNWFELPTDYKTSDQPMLYTPAKSPWQSWPVETLIKTHSTNIGNQLTLVQTNVPHSINTGPIDRWGISLRARDINIVKWSDAVDHFSSHIVGSNA